MRGELLRFTAALALLTLVCPGSAEAQGLYSYDIRHSLTGGIGGRVPRLIIQARDGNFYGTTVFGGAYNLGTIFKLTPGGTFTTLHSFSGAGPGLPGTLPLDGGTPRNLVQGADGDFYGTTSGPNVFFKITASGTLTVLSEFSLTDGEPSVPGLFQAADGNFYGVAIAGGANFVGTVYKVTPAGTITVPHTFAVSMTDGQYPTSIVQGSDGNFYGTTSAGGATDWGTIFRMTPAGVITLLHSFNASTGGGYRPGTAMVQAADGNFYGTTIFGGSASAGTAFKITPGGFFTHLYSFVGAEGLYPGNPLVLAQDANFYSAVQNGGANGAGTIFRMTPAGVVTALYSFDLFGGGAGSRAVSLIQAMDGSFYGTSATGGDFLSGVVFQFAQQASPAITGQPISQTVPLGGSLQLIVTAVATPAPAYQWQISTNGGVTWTNLANAAPYNGVTTSTLSISGATVGLNATQYRCTVANTIGSAMSTAATLTVARPTSGDFDTDGRADLAVFRPSNGNWYVLRSSTNNSTHADYQWGVSTDKPVPGDYDGDGKTDLAVYRPATGVWYVLMSSTNFAVFVSYQWGISTDTPVPGDYDGDGKTDVAIYRPATGAWHVLRSSANNAPVSYQWGVSTDIPVPADYDGDRKADIAIYRPATGAWYILRSSTGSTTFTSYQWGISTDTPVPSDYDGDGKTDVAIYRPATGAWYILRSSTNSTTFTSYQWGVSTDTPVPSDYDGDGKTDVAIYRPSTGAWFVLLSTTNSSTFVSYQWGVSTDIPVLTRP